MAGQVISPDSTAFDTVCSAIRRAVVHFPPAIVTIPAFDTTIRCDRETLDVGDDEWPPQGGLGRIARRVVEREPTVGVVGCRAVELAELDRLRPQAVVNCAGHAA